MQLALTALVDQSREMASDKGLLGPKQLEVTGNCRAGHLRFNDDVHGAGLIGESPVGCECGPAE